MENQNISNSIDSGLCFNLSYRKATRVISQIYDHELADCGLKCTQFSILRAVQHLIKTTNVELQDMLVLNQTTLTRGIKPLIRDGFISAVASEHDQRKKILSLTPAGQGMYRKAEKKWRQAQQYIQKHLGPEMTTEMIKMNQALVNLR